MNFYDIDAVANHIEARESMLNRAMSLLRELSEADKLPYRTASGDAAAKAARELLAKYDGGE